eukprot:356308-Chlamydomonas_euryale.AAC.3
MVWQSTGGCAVLCSSEIISLPFLLVFLNPASILPVNGCSYKSMPVSAPPVYAILCPPPFSPPMAPHPLLALQWLHTPSWPSSGSTPPRSNPRACRRLLRARALLPHADCRHERRAARRPGVVRRLAAATAGRSAAAVGGPCNAHRGRASRARCS